MKNCLILILIFCSLNVFSQVPKSSENFPELDSWIIPTSKVEKMKIIQKLGGNQSLSNYYIVDFNCDGISDVINFGHPGIDVDMMTLLKGNSNGTYSTVIHLNGRLIEISEYDGYTPLSFAILDIEPGNGVINLIERYTPVWKNSDFSYELQSKYSTSWMMDMPKTRLKKPIGFKTINEKYYLRLNPYINDTILLEIINKKSNKFAEYPKNSEGIAIAQQTDETGRIWWFVIMKNNLNPNWSFYLRNGSNNNAKSHYLGWISSKYVEELR